VCLAKPDPAFQENFPMMNKPKLWPVLVPWQNNLECNQMLGGYVVVIKANHDEYYAVKKIKGYSELVHIWKGVMSAQLGQLPGTIKMLLNSLKLCEKITAATNDNLFAACKFHHEISISIEKSDLVSSTVLFWWSNQEGAQCRVHTHGILYHQVPLKPMLAMNKLIYQKNKVDFFGTINSNAATQTQLLQYSCMVSLLGVASNNLNKYVPVFDLGDVRQEWVDTIITPFLIWFKNHMLTPAFYIGDDIIFDFWVDTWVAGTLREPHLLTATQILVQEGEADIDLFHEMLAIGTLLAMTELTHISMSGYGHLIGNFGQVMIPPHNVKLQGINLILNEAQINPWIGKGFQCNFWNGGFCLGGQTKEVVAERVYDKCPTPMRNGGIFAFWNEETMLKQLTFFYTDAKHRVSDSRMNEKMKQPKHSTYSN
jgi:hypothetical protein